MYSNINNAVPDPTNTPQIEYANEVVPILHTHSLSTNAVNIHPPPSVGLTFDNQPVPLIPCPILNATPPYIMTPLNSGVMVPQPTHLTFNQPNILDKPKYNVLCLDGGGMRGLIQCEMLRFIETYTGTPIYELFDMIVGTSTGAILGSMLNQRNLSCERVTKEYEYLGSHLFGKKRWRGWFNFLLHGDRGVYDSRKAEELSKSTLGTNRMFNPENPNPARKLVVVSCEFDKSLDKYRTVLFRNYKSKYRDRGTQFEHVKLYEAVNASTAAPFYLDAVTIDGAKFFDGGVMHNNPTMQGLMEARLVYGLDKKITLLSLGTGVRTLSEVAEDGSESGELRNVNDNNTASRRHRKGNDNHQKQKGVSANLLRLLNVCCDNDRICRDVEKYIATSAKPGQIEYNRFSPEGLGDIGLATGDPLRWWYMIEKSREFVEQNRDDFEKICQQLLADH